MSHKKRFTAYGTLSDVDRQGAVTCKKKGSYAGQELSFQFTCPFGQVLSGPQNYLSQKIGNSNLGFQKSFFHLNDAPVK